jgi:hypothetical protein
MIMGCTVQSCWYHDDKTTSHCRIYEYLGDEDSDPIMVHPMCRYYGMEVAKSHRKKVKE